MKEECKNCRHYENRDKPKNYCLACVDNSKFSKKEDKDGNNS